MDRVVQFALVRRATCWISAARRLRAPSRPKCGKESGVQIGPARRRARPKVDAPTVTNTLPGSSRPARTPKPSVVVPLFGEGPCIKEVLQRVRAVEIDKELIVIDDRSIDSTRGCLSQMQDRQTRASEIENLNGITLLRLDHTPFGFQSKNRGKSAAPRRGSPQATAEPTNALGPGGAKIRGSCILMDSSESCGQGNLGPRSAAWRSEMA